MRTQTENLYRNLYPPTLEKVISDLEEQLNDLINFYQNELSGSRFTNEDKKKHDYLLREIKKAYQVFVDYNPYNQYMINKLLSIK